MANPHKGEIEIEAGGKTYILRLSIDAICALEARTGKTFTKIAAELCDPDLLSLSLVREVFHAALVEHHPDLTLRQAGELIVDAGGTLQVVAWIDKAFGATFPPATSGENALPPGMASESARTGSPS